jgi:hypothetical protein
MHINYILNLQKKNKPYVGSGSFELVGSASANIAQKYFSGIKFYINQTGTTVDNKKYSIYQVQGTGNSPIYATSNTLSFQFLNNDNLFTDSEITTILSNKYNNKVVKYENLISYINNKLNTVPLPVDKVYLSNIKFNLNEVYVNLENENKKVISIVGTENNPEYISDNQVSNNDNALAQTENIEYVINKNDKSIAKYENKLNYINNKISGMTPPLNTLIKTNAKFRIKEDGFNDFNKAVNIRSVMGSTYQIYYDSNEGVYKENQLLDASEAAVHFQQKYDNNLSKYIAKLNEINGRLNA